MRLNRVLPALALAFALAGGTAMAGSIHVMPTTITLGPGKATAVMTITNEGDAPIRTQVRVFAWDQKDFEDRLTPTQKVVARPPMATRDPTE